MPRKKLSEFRAKTILSTALGQPYEGWEIDVQADDWRQVIKHLDGKRRYVIKIDQAEKGRFKKGLVKLDRSPSDLVDDAEAMFATGYRYALVEPYHGHAAEEERYLAIERTRQGNRVSYSSSGGVDVEEQGDHMAGGVYDGQTLKGVDVPASVLAALIQAFDDNHFCFLEINPLLIHDQGLGLLDAAVEVDSEAEFFEDGWQEGDLRSAKSRQLLPEEVAVQALAAKSQASFSLEVINPNGSIFVLLSGGGASVVVADEVSNLGFGDQLGNYGEYSGNPNFEETRIYTEMIVQLMLQSEAPRKILIIGGGVANFTDIRTTFKGVIAGLQAHEPELRQQHVKVFVRRGGPHEREGLAAIREYLEDLGIAGTIAGPELLLSDIVAQAVAKEKA